jgi:hypothetical protein
MVFLNTTYPLESLNTCLDSAVTVVSSQQLCCFPFHSAVIVVSFQQLLLPILLYGSVVTMVSSQQLCCFPCCFRQLLPCSMACPCTACGPVYLKHGVGKKPSSLLV